MPTAWGLGPRSRSLGGCFAGNLVRPFVPPICWDYFANFGGGGGLMAVLLHPSASVKLSERCTGIVLYCFEYCLPG